MQTTIHSNRDASTASTAPLSTCKQATMLRLCAEKDSSISTQALTQHKDFVQNVVLNLR